MDSILAPFMFVISWIMYGCHDVLNFILPSAPIAVTGAVPAGVSTFTLPGHGSELFYMPATAGWNWVLAIVMLTMATRILLMPLFVRQIRSSRAMQLLQPEIQKIQAKYKGKTDQASKQKMTEETMALYKKAGANPMSGCWPVLLQMPVFFALYRVLYNIPAIANGGSTVGPINQNLAIEFENSSIFGASFSQTFLNGTTAVKVVGGILIVAMVGVTFLTQHQLTMKNMPPSAMADDNPMARNTKMMMYAMPFIYLITGPAIPLGVLIYWLTTNVWTFGQQFFVIRKTPAPGSEAEKKMLERKKLHAERRGETVVEEANAAVMEIAPKGQRQQPVRKGRQRPAARDANGQPLRPTVKQVDMPKEVVLSSGEDDASMPAPSMGVRRKKKDDVRTAESSEEASGATDEEVGSKNSPKRKR